MSRCRGVALFRKLFGLYLAWLSLCVVSGGIANVFTMNESAFGDWLLNYSGGFIRRGLCGELIYLVSGHGRLPPAWLVLMVQLVCYALLIFTLRLLTNDLKPNVLLLLLLVSPATLAFPILCPPAAFKKEILLFALLCCTILASLGRLRLNDITLSAGLALASAFLVLTHEAMAAFFPYVLTPLFLDARRTWRGALAISAGPVAAAFLCSVLAVTHPGGKKASVMICNTVQTMTHDHNPHLCDGAVRAVGMSPREAHEEVDSYYRSYHYSELYGIAGLLSLLPVIAAVLWIQNPRQRWIVICAAALAGVASVPLFLYAVDWGRWIYIHALCCTLLVLRCAMLRNTTGQKEEGSQREPPAEWVWTGRRRAIAFSLAVYATCWTLPFCGQFPSHFGYLSLGQFARNYLRIHGARHPGVSMGVVAPQTSPSGSTPASSGSTRR